MRLSRGIASMVITTAVLVAGCRGSATGEGPATTPAPVSTDRFDALYQARIDSARTRFTDADVRFMTGMIVHHAQALVMSAWAPTNGASAPIQTLTARIINSQKDEIARMQQWLRDRGQPVPEVMIHGDELMVHGADHMMPGMLTDEQLDTLGRARGSEFDRLFLTYMIQHHRGALVMVEELLANEGAVQGNEIFKLASDINVDQATEIARMEGMLAEMTSAAGR